MTLACDSASILSLGAKHEEIFRQALLNLFATDLVERAYAQILDGLPTEESMEDSYLYMKGHPVYEIPHTEICSGFIEKVREFRARFDPSQLEFEPFVRLNAPFPLHVCAKADLASYSKPIQKHNQAQNRFIYGS